MRPTVASVISYVSPPEGRSPGAITDEACISSGGGGGGGGVMPIVGTSPAKEELAKTHVRAKAITKRFIVLLLFEVLDDAKILTSAGNRATSRTSCKRNGSKLLSEGVKP